MLLSLSIQPPSWLIRMRPLEQVLEIAIPNLALEPERAAAVANELTPLLTSTRVVILAPISDRRLIIGVMTRTKFSDRQHERSPTDSDRLPD